MHVLYCFACVVNTCIFVHASMSFTESLHKSLGCIGFSKVIIIFHCGTD